MDPANLTLRELIWMADGRSRELWNHTASVLALLANVHRDPKKGRPLRPGDFHPMQGAETSAAPLHRRPAADPQPPMVPVTILRTLFVENRPCSA